MVRDWLNAGEIAELLGIKKRDTAAALIRDGTIPGKKVGREYRVSRTAVDAFLAANGGRWRRHPVGRGPSRYDPLADLLRGLNTDVVRMTFAEVEQLVGPLPPAARARPSWWANTDPRTHSQARAWCGVGWRMAKVRLEEETVIFDRPPRA